MKKSDLNKYRNVLEAKQTELVHILRKRDGIAIEKCPDSLDEVQYATARELAICSLDRDSNLLRNVRVALDRIAEGSYGVCLHCDEDISPKRLAAVPSTAFCIVCQEIADGAEILDELLVTAA
jgi:DnaK suppressor protein